MKDKIEKAKAEIKEYLDTHDVSTSTRQRLEQPVYMDWWGYRHINGKFQAKRFFDIEDVYDAKTSPFVARAVGPFKATSREDALAKVAHLTMGSK